MIVKALRVVVGQLVVFISFLTRPSPMQREPAAQAAVNEAASALALYQFHGCPFCVKTRRTLRRLNLPVQLRDASGNAEHRETLLREGGKIQVPCLRIEEDGQTRWLYESSAIGAYLEERFAA
ncbi:MAG TPA: glutaredoxin [Pseudomonas sp.]|nr:glutaredoxin [Pseudomonadales bacterium]HCB41575.1 glutaredoxin [Pseudomonas sp.]HCL40796.1 glutaredoxin [Pseudomonas sp.]|tara:strand:+ start:201 stop:569 length:369 start_codon:yes stop_codon:yes gene_type:complete